MCICIMVFSVSVVFANSILENENIDVVDCSENVMIEGFTEYSRDYIHIASRDGRAAENEEMRAWVIEHIIETEPDNQEDLIAVDSEPEFVNMEVPYAQNTNTGFKSFMDYRALTNKRSEQYKLQQDATTNDEGFRIYDDCYMVAMGTYYVNNIGEKFRITLEDDTVFYAVAGDIKSDLHTDSKHQHKNGNIVEFIVDMQQISSTCRKMGDMSYAGLYGKIKSIEKIIEQSGE